MRYVIEGQKKSAYYDNSKPWYLLGIVSFGTRRCGNGNPAVYTRQELRIPLVRKQKLDSQISPHTYLKSTGWSPSYPGFETP